MIRVQSTPQLHGKPVYKSQEEQYDEIQLLRHRAADLRDDNQLLRAQLAKCREELGRRYREAERRLEDAAAKSDPVNGSGTSISGLKLRVFRLEQVLREKEEEVRRLRADTRTSRLQEMRLQVQVYYRELLRLRRQLTERRRDPMPSDPAAAAEARRLRRENRRLRSMLGDTETLPEPLRVKHQASSRTELILTLESLEASVRRSSADYQLVLKQASRHQRAKEEQERRRQEEERRRSAAEQERDQYRTAVQRWRRETQAADAALQRQNADLLNQVGRLQEELRHASASRQAPAASAKKRRGSDGSGDSIGSANGPIENGTAHPERASPGVDIAVGTEWDDVAGSRRGPVLMSDVGLDPILVSEVGLDNGCSPVDSDAGRVTHSDPGGNGEPADRQMNAIAEQKEGEEEEGEGSGVVPEGASAPEPGTDGETARASETRAGGTSAEDVIKTWVELQLQGEQRRRKDKERVNWLAEIRRDLAARVLQRGWRAYKRRREIEMEDVVLSFRRRCAARRIAAGWKRYDNRKKLRQTLSVIRRLARGHLRRVALLGENAAILALPDPEPAPEPSTGLAENHTSAPPSVGGAANHSSDPRSKGGAVEISAAVRVVQSAVREVLTQAVLAGSGDDGVRS